ncbi:COMM domain-containing protein 2 [Anoplophora glabripennis]|uniref:COMM domain-containing protein 2 n=1 Tax=Anoplophora glabripennis TaxID=217634 RepID=UPI000874235D|nr:COMM domain-containing protein 2 [Anoplophora glabripennis]
MLISLRSDHKEHLQLLTKQPIQVIVDFCKLALDFLQNGPNLKRYTTAAQKLEVEVDVVQNCIFGLTNLLILSCKHKLSEADFRDSVLTIGFSHEQQVVLSKFYESKQNDIHKLNQACINEPHYEDLKWRFEVQVSSRSLLQQVTPLIAMELVLRKKNEGTGIDREKILVQTDPNNLLHIANELENALTESRSRHSRKIQRALKN